MNEVQFFMHYFSTTTDLMVLLTELVPQLPTLVGHRCALGLPQQKTRVEEELFRDEGQHSSTVRVLRSQHLPHLERLVFYKIANKIEVHLADLHGTC